MTLGEYFPDLFFKTSLSLKKSFAVDSGKDELNQRSKDNSDKKETGEVSSARTVADTDIRPELGGLSVSPVRILFAGDSMMQGVAPIAISNLRKISPKGYFEDLSKQSTGLTVNRYLDWPLTIKEQIAKKHFTTVVIFLGPNDPWDIVDGKQRYKFPSPEWEGKYRSRVREVLDSASENNVKIIWIGLPSMRDERLHRGAVIQNKIFKEEVSSYGYSYISTEDLLGNLDSPFKHYVYDAGGKEIVVRASDGTHFSPQGLRIISNKLVDMIADGNGK